MSTIFDTHWPWMGIGIACVLIILLFFTNTLRSDLRVNRWYDPFWLAWFSSTAYFIHNFEEYGIDLFGRHFEFPHLMTQTMHITPEISFFTMINIPLIWIAGPILAMMSKHRPVISLIMTGLMFTNALSHIVPLISSGMYTSGLFTSIVIFIPGSLWIYYIRFIKGNLRWSILIVSLIPPIITQGLLMLSILMYRNDFLNDTTVTVFELLNGCLFIIIAFIMEKPFKRKYKN